jgi:putative ABC transport system permease protein
MTKWLKNFAYKTDINWLVFGEAFIGATLVVLLTVFVHAYKASHVNPAEALRHE